MNDAYMLGVKLAFASVGLQKLAQGGMIAPAGAAALSQPPPPPSAGVTNPGGSFGAMQTRGLPGQPAQTMAVAGPAAPSPEQMAVMQRPRSSNIR